METEKQQLISNRMENFLYLINPFGSSDLRTAIEIFEEVGLNENDLYDQMTEFQESTDTPKLEDIDICYIALDYVFENARNEIENILDIDISNDLDFYVYGNYRCSSIDGSSESREELQKAINKLSKEDKQKLKDDDFISYVLSDLDIDIK